MPTGERILQRPEEGAGGDGHGRTRELAFASRSGRRRATPNGPAVAEVIEAIAAASIELAALIADGPLAGITGRLGGINSDGDQQKDIDLAADEMMRRALRTAPVAAILSEECRAPGNPRSRGAVVRCDRSARRLGQSRKQYLGRDHLFDHAPAAMTFCRPSSSPVRRNAPPASLFTVRRPRWCWR